MSLCLLPLLISGKIGWWSLKLLLHFKILVESKGGLKMRERKIGSSGQLELSGEIMNLLGYSLRMLHRRGTDLKSTFSAGTEVYIMVREERPHAEGTPREVSAAKVSILHPFIKDEAEMRETGNINGLFTLVCPTRLAPAFLDWREYWQAQVRDHGAYLRELPDIRALNERSDAMKTYCVVSPDVALMVYYQRREDINFLLVPACPVHAMMGGSRAGNDRLVGFRAFMPAQYLLLD